MAAELNVVEVLTSALVQLIGATVQSINSTDFTLTLLKRAREVDLIVFNYSWLNQFSLWSITVKCTTGSGKLR